MIHKLRFRFIRITMIAIFVVLTLIISAINLVNISQNNQALDLITQSLADNILLIPPKPKGATQNRPADFPGINGGRRFSFQNEKELPYSTRFFTIRINADHEIIGFNLRQIASVTETDLESNFHEEFHEVCAGYLTGSGIRVVYPSFHNYRDIFQTGNQSYCRSL